MSINSRAKGQRGELEVRDLLRKHGFQAERGQQRAGGPESPDVKHDIDGFHIEVKLTETFNLFKTLDQAQGDAPHLVPLIFHRRNRKPWMVCLPAEVLLELLRKGV
jgi:Holliday junction resolvase